MKRILTLSIISLMTASLYAGVYFKEHQTNASAETTVLVCNSTGAYAYHKYECGGLKRCKATVSEITLSEAKAKRRKACGICYK
jgi:hypothetical protein